MKRANDNGLSGGHGVERPSLVIQALVTAICLLGEGIGRDRRRNGLSLIDEVDECMKQIASRHSFSDRDANILTNTIEMAREAAVKASADNNPEKSPARPLGEMPLNRIGFPEAP